MKWNIEKSNQLKLYTGEVKNTSRYYSMLEMWKLIKKSIIPENQGIQWDHLRVELWADSGRIIIFPALWGSCSRIEKSACQVVFSELLKVYDELADSDIDDDAFANKLNFTLSAWVNDLSKTAVKSGLAETQLSFWDSDSEEPLH